MKKRQGTAVILNYAGGETRWGILRSDEGTMEINYPPRHMKVQEEPDEELREWYLEWLEYWRWGANMRHTVEME